MVLDLDTIHEGDCLTLLKQIPSDSLDALASDPPSGAGILNAVWDKFKADALPANVRKYFAACDPELVGFQEFLVAVFKECFRVLKSGAYGVIWSLPRTSHHTAMALERAGFEIRDAIPHLFSKAMPKSINISKALDAKAGAERPVLGYESSLGIQRPISPDWTKSVKVPSKFGIPGNNPDGRLRAITKPQTPEAQKWAGFGTALRPSVELWWLIRKPLAEKTIVGQVQATGTGALNIDACRIPHASAADFEKHKQMVDRIREKGGQMAGSWKNSSDLSGANEVTPAGRWPTNALLTHSVSCKLSIDPDGTPIVTECAPDCPVARLNAQSGPSVSRPDSRDGGSMDLRGIGWRFQRKPSTVNDAGGASRFFTTFVVEPDDPFRYCPKPSPSEKDAGLGCLMRLRPNLTEAEQAYVAAELQAVGVVL